MKSSGHIQLLARIYTNSVICMYSYKYCNLHNNVQAEKCQARNPWRVSVLLVQLRWMGAAGGWNDAVLAQVQEHLPVVIGGLATVVVWHAADRSEEHTSELQSRLHLVCRLLL